MPIDILKKQLEAYRQEQREQHHKTQELLTELLQGQTAREEREKRIDEKFNEHGHRLGDVEDRLHNLELSEASHQFLSGLLEKGITRFFMALIAIGVGAVFVFHKGS